VRITSGNSALGPTDTPNTDVVVTDDFIYSEPRVVPEPTSMLLFGTGLTAFAVVLKKRR
jgi:hypothetical protein